MLLVCAHHMVSSSLGESARAMHVQMENTWAFTPVKWKGETFTLTGRPDYGVWYGDKEEIEVNVIVVEAKRPDDASLGVPQALAYMCEYFSIPLS